MGQLPTTEKTIESVWDIAADESRSVTFLHVLVMLILIAIGFILGALGSIVFPLAFGVNYFWIGIVVQQVGSIWFGGWGIIASTIFPFLSNGIAGTPWYISAAYIPANALQAFLPAWVFRQFKADPALTSLRDYTLLLAAMIVSSGFGALWSSLVLVRSFDLLEIESLPLYIWGWFGGNVVAGLVLNFLLLKTLSPVVVRTLAFVKRWWA